MKIGFMCALLGVLSLGASPADAQAWKKRPLPIAGKPGDHIAPDKAYLLYRAEPDIPILLLRNPTEVDRAAYRADRARLLAGAQQEQALNPAINPVLITDANFDFPPIEVMMRVNISDSRIAAPGLDGEYLVAIQPGTYSVYGVAGPGEFGFAGRCMCMGTVRFEARAGQVTDLGEFKWFKPGTAAEGDLIAGQTSLAIVPSRTAQSLQEPFAGVNSIAADYQAAGKIPNVLRIEIDRLTPIPGILAYDRDTIVDLRKPDSAAQ